MRFLPLRYIFTLLWMVVLLLPAEARGLVQLKGMTKKDDLAGTVVRFEFSNTPVYRVAGSGQRIDLFFSNTTVLPDLPLLREDGRIIKMLLAQSREELMVSLLLRQIPARVTATTEKTSATVQLELFWQEGRDERPAIAFRISGLPTPQEHAAVAAPGPPSKYSGQWRQFFDTYQSPFKIKAPLVYSMPKLPSPAKNLFPPELAEQLVKIGRGDWSGVVLDEPSSSGPSREAPFRLLQAEGLLGQDHPREALKILEDFRPDELPGELQPRADYLHSLALAKSGKPYRAKSRLKTLTASPTCDLYPHALLLMSELALATGEPQQALEALDTPRVNWPDGLQTLKNLRTADGLTEKNPEQALKIYRRLQKMDIWPENRPFSLSHAAWAFFQAREREKADQLYNQLILLLPADPAQGLARFAAALNTYRSGNVAGAQKILWQLTKDFPDTESANRANLKLLDNDVLNGGENRLVWAIRGYEDIAREAENRILREEAAFKYCLTLFLSGDRSRTVKALDDFCRDFAGGPLRKEAQALLTEILPPLIEKLIADGQDLQAVVLVEKYRELLLERNDNWPFLPALAQAFTRLGLFDRGIKVYLYLLEKAEKRSDADRFYLPLTSLYFDMDEHAAVEKYARRYLVNFPRGTDRNAIFLLLVRSLQKLNRFEDAAELLKERNRPTDNQIELEAERVFWHLGEYGWVITSGSRLGDGGKPIPPQGLLLQAEAMRLLGRAPKALPLYQVLAEDGTFGDQATFRCGEILLAEGHHGEALNLFRKLVEKGKDPIWQKLAEDALESARF
jgi:tetratricopeptide (TPR) repeat protein